MLYDSSLSDEDHFKKIAYSDFLSLIKDNNDNENYGESFFLVVRGSSKGCRCWSGVRENIAQYAKNKNLLVYYMSLDDDFKEKGVDKDFKGLKLKSGEQTIAIFEKGSLKYQTNIDDESEYGKDYKALANYLNERIKVGTILYINKKQLDSFYENGDSGAPFVVGFSRSGCSDCSYINSHHLKELAVNEKYKNSYIIDCDTEGIRKYNGEEADKSGSENAQIAYQNWIDFKNEYGLSDSSNADFGYKEGFVPTWTFNLPGLGKATSVRDMIVWGNDTITKKENEYFISETYFDGSRNHPFLGDKSILDNAKVTTTNLLNMKITESELTFYGETAYWTHEASAKFEDPLLTAFFDYYCAK